MPTAASLMLPRLATTVRWLAILALSQVATGAVTLRAQAPVRAPRFTAADSVDAIEEARRAQRRFEGVRRAALPIRERSGASPCDVRIGRYCYWYDTTGRPPVPREAENVTMARRRFIAVLDSLGSLSPGDAWIAGQRVRYRIDALDTARAVDAAASRCGTPGWWCDALRGYALHVAGRHEAAGRAFDRALSAMPVEDRCAWENPAVLLDPEARRTVQRLPCDARRRVAERVWWLGIPQLARAGNDLRTEFLARRVASVLESDARFIYGARWAWDTNELLLRYGWPTWWTRERSYSVSGPSELLLVGHEPVPAFDFLPAAASVLEPRAAMHDDAWDPEQPSPTMRYAPSYLTRWRRATAQVARLRRGDTLLVVAAFEAPADSMLRDPEAMLVLSAGPHEPRHRSAPVRALRGVARARIPGGSGDDLLASVEVVDHARRAMARYRMSLGDAPRGRLALSDLLLHRAVDLPAATTTLDDVADLLLPATTVSGERVGVYWETYGVRPEGEMLDVALTIERLDAPWLRRAAARLRLADPITPVRIRWRESPRADGSAAPRSVSVNVANLADGEYRFRLRVQGDDGAQATSERTVRIRAR